MVLRPFSLLQDRREEGVPLGRIVHDRLHWMVGMASDVRCCSESIHFLCKIVIAAAMLEKKPGSENDPGKEKKEESGYLEFKFIFLNNHWLKIPAVFPSFYLNMAHAPVRPPDGLLDAFNDPTRILKLVERSHG